MTMVINGSGTITGLSAGGLPDATITQAEIGTGVAGTGPAFSAYAGALTACSNASYTKVPFNTEEFDTNSNYDTSTSRFTPTVAGYYQINAAVGLAATTSSPVYVLIYKNGVAAKHGELATSSTIGTISIVSALLSMNGATDYVEVYVYQASGVSKNTVPSSTDTYFQASMVRAA